MRYLIFVLGLLLAVPAAAEETSPLVGVARKIAGQIQSSPGDLAPLYAPSFLKAVPEAQLSSLYTSFFQKYGTVARVELRSQTDPSSGLFTFHFRDVEIPVELVIEADPSHRVTGLLFRSPVARLGSADDVTSHLAALPGVVSYQLERLDDGKVLQALNPDKALAIGSAFKLYVLATLLQQKVPWDKVVNLQKRYKSLPSGDMRNWPDGSPVTVHTLALKMISESDNTAADHLLALAGRRQVEALLPELGIRNSSADVPFISTRELFTLKSEPTLLKRYLESDGATRAELLGKLDAMSAPGVAAFATDKPVAIDRVEWFASASDLCRLMKWFVRQADAAALSILAVNPGLGFSSEKFDYAGYKGGSEPGVLNMTWLLHSRAGHHYAMSASWNNTENAVEIDRLAPLLIAAVDLLEESPSTAPASAK